MITALKK